MIEFNWDDANREHPGEHDVSAEEAEHALTHDPVDVEVQIRESEERLVQIGATSRGRILVLVSTIRDGLIRVVTAFDASRRYRLIYERQRGLDHGTET